MRFGGIFIDDVILSNILSQLTYLFLASSKVQFHNIRVTKFLVDKVHYVGERQIARTP